MHSKIALYRWIGQANESTTPRAWLGDPALFQTRSADSVIGPPIQYLERVDRDLDSSSCDVSGSMKAKPARGASMADQSLDGIRFEYEKLAALERDMTGHRYTTFTALLAVSFILPGLADTCGDAHIEPLGLKLDLSNPVFALGFLFYCFTVTHYIWYHRITETLRERLRDLERQGALNIRVYRLWERPNWLLLKRFHWTLYILGFFYFILACLYSGWILMVGLVIATLLLTSIGSGAHRILRRVR
jgi:hypothetical protein